MSRKIAVIGECMIELSQKGADVQRGFGGDTLNTSVYIARQVDATALSVHYVTALGTDSFSQQMLESWQGENVDTSLTQRMENRLPGLYYIETDSTGERTFYYWRNEAAAKFWLESEQSAAICEELATFDYLYLSGISLAILSPASRDKLLSLLRECRANGGKVIFDNNYRPRLWSSKEETQQVYQQMLESWQGENVDTSLTQRMENRLPGLYYIETDSTGERTFYYWRNEAAAKFWLESEQSAAICEELATFDYLYLSGISLAILSPASRDKLLSLLQECRANGGKVIFDNNYRPRLWSSKEETQQVYQQMLECTNIAFLTLDDEDALWGEKPVAEVIARTHAAGVQEVVVKRGADSCLVSIAGEELIDIPAVKLPKEKVIDTTAAGDSFSAGYLAVRLTGGDAAEAAKRGHLTASTVIQHRGAIIPRDAMPQ